MKRKGLSQVLWLIIAAAVLMMVSMALTFTTQGTLGNFASSSSENACIQTMDNQLASSVSGDSFGVPGTCLSDDGNPITPELQNAGATGSGVICVTSNNANYGDTGTWDAASSASNC